MIYFFCVMLFFVVLCGKAKGWQGALALVVIDAMLILAILKIGGWL